MTSNAGNERSLDIPEFPACCWALLYLMYFLHAESNITLESLVLYCVSPSMLGPMRGLHCLSTEIQGRGDVQSWSGFISKMYIALHCLDIVYVLNFDLKYFVTILGLCSIPPRCDVSSTLCNKFLELFCYYLMCSFLMALFCYFHRVTYELTMLFTLKNLTLA